MLRRSILSSKPLPSQKTIIDILLTVKVKNTRTDCLVMHMMKQHLPLSSAANYSTSDKLASIQFHKRPERGSLPNTQLRKHV